MTERQLEVLLAVIYEYLSTGEPVGSRAVVRKYIKWASPATVRNEMADLESMGYFYQPHASAGRVPTEKAYRLYVDQILRRRRPLREEGWEGFFRDLLVCREDLEERLKQVTQMLGRLTSCVGLSGLSATGQSKLEALDFMRMEDGSVMLVLVMGGGFLARKRFKPPREISEGELAQISSELSALFVGRPWSEVSRSLGSYLQRQLELYRSACETVESFLSEDCGRMRLFFGGTSNILKVPEMSDLARLQVVLELLEEGSRLSRLLEELSGEGDLKVLIGSDIPIEGMQDLSVITASCTVEGLRIVLGVLGPKRMDYERAVLVLERALSAMKEGREGA